MSDRCNCEYGALGTGRMDSNRCLVHDFTHDELVEHFIETINVYEKDYEAMRSRTARLERVATVAREAHDIQAIWDMVPPQKYIDVYNKLNEALKELEE